MAMSFCCFLVYIKICSFLSYVCGCFVSMYGSALCMPGASRNQKGALGTGITDGYDCHVRARNIIQAL